MEPDPHLAALFSGGEEHDIHVGQCFVGTPETNAQIIYFKLPKIIKEAGFKSPVLERHVDPKQSNFLFVPKYAYCSEVYAK